MDFGPYISVAVRRKRAEAAMAKLAKKGKRIAPIKIEGRAIAKSFWGRSWCEHLEAYSDLANRLPRGKTYARNGSICHLGLDRGKIEALIQGSQLYTVHIEIKKMGDAKWKKLMAECSSGIHSVVALLQGKLSPDVMTTVTHKEKGLFPHPNEISMSCTCPDSASMCKHIAAALYGIGARLDQEPELLFQLRGVDHVDLISQASARVPEKRTGKSKKIANEQDLSSLFGIEIERAPAKASSKARPKKSPKKK